MNIATTAIWDVKDNLKRVLNYANNPEKNTETLQDGLENVLEYTTLDTKTEKQCFVSGINCSPKTVYEEMQSTKVMFQKTQGILAYHAYQSFRPGEVTAELAHTIGVKLAKEMWGDRFEVLVSTHLDKAHFHNHFVINSISFVDGYRYYDNKENYKKLRQKSDALCQQYQLSIIEEPKNNSLHYAEWKAEKEQKPTLRSLVREDVDYAIAHSLTMKQFYQQLKELGYTLKFGKYIAIRPKGKDRFIRLKSLDKNGRYTEQNIKQCILDQNTIHWESFQKAQTDLHFVYKGQLSKARKITGIKALYFKYMFQLGILPKQAPRKRVSFLLKEDLLYIDKITKEITLICKKKIHTQEDLDQYEDKAKTKLDHLIKERRCIYNKIKRCQNPTFKEQLQQDVASISSEIRELRKEVVLYADIRQRTDSIRHKFREIEKEEKEKNKTQGRSVIDRPL